MVQGTKQGQSQGLWCFSQGEGEGLKRDVQVPRSVPSPAPWAVSGRVLRGCGVGRGNLCVSLSWRPEERPTSTGSYWRGAGHPADLVTVSLLLEAQGSHTSHCCERTGRASVRLGVPRNEGRSLRTGSAQGWAQEQEGKTHRGKSGWPFPCKWVSRDREDVAQRKIWQQLISYCPSVPAEQRQVQRKGQVHI